MDTEKERADHLEVLLEGSREDRDAECERLQRNIDSLKEQLDVRQLGNQTDETMGASESHERLIVRAPREK